MRDNSARFAHWIAHPDVDPCKTLNTPLIHDGTFTSDVSPFLFIGHMRPALMDTLLNSPKFVRESVPCGPQMIKLACDHNYHCFGYMLGHCDITLTHLHTALFYVLDRISAKKQPHIDQREQFLRQIFARVPFGQRLIVDSDGAHLERPFVREMYERPDKTIAVSRIFITRRSAACLFALVVLVADDYLRLAGRAAPPRFLKIALALPQELQMLVCNMIEGRNKATIAPHDVTEWSRIILCAFG